MALCALIMLPIFCYNISNISNSVKAYSVSLYAFFAPHLWGANLPRQGATKGGSRGFPTLARYTYGSATSNIGLLVVTHAPLPTPSTKHNERS